MSDDEDDPIAREERRRQRQAQREAEKTARIDKEKRIMALREERAGQAANGNRRAALQAAAFSLGAGASADQVIARALELVRWLEQ
ncbi:MAG TPA: hypothetical protein VG819_01905 [Rhizomicrobium sp.]|jgi:hypothetical protein|nr:hypothetical protein [Rhizomicrobium sp.]